MVLGVSEEDLISRMLPNRCRNMKPCYTALWHRSQLCWELVRTVPFVGNTALIFMNVPGMAHGAGIPRDALQLERYAYQFYIGPPKSDLVSLVRQLPQEQAAAWNAKLSDDEY